MKSIFFVVSLFLFVPLSSSLAQETVATEAEIIEGLNRIQGIFQLANNGIVGTTSLEPVQFQVEQFEELQKQREVLQKKLPLPSQLKMQMSV